MAFVKTQAMLPAKVMHNLRRIQEDLAKVRALIMGGIAENFNDRQWVWLSSYFGKAHNVEVHLEEHFGAILQEGDGGLDPPRLEGVDESEDEGYESAA